ncbi:MAG: hypothetical protein WCR17_04530 [Candidatus Methanomethylophilaceae archaeon]
MDLTARELMLMVTGRRKESWTHTSALIALIYNALSKEPKSPDDFNPYADGKEKEPIKKVKVKDLKNIFFDKNQKFRGMK